MSEKKKKAEKVETKVVHTSGKRKRAVARATLWPGKGNIRINRMLLQAYGNEWARLRIGEPLVLAGELASQIDVDINVAGGGWASQAEASRLALAKALVAFSKSKDLKKTFIDYDRHLLVADTRYKEPRKFGTHSKARSKRQKSYR
jgi:small subunit ribosomal protein S9